MADYFDEMGWRPLENGESPNHFLHFARFLRDFGIYTELGKELPPPTAKEYLKNLMSNLVTDLRQQCTVCLAPEKKESMIKLPCNHCFHSECILPWLEKTSTCPLCRLDLPTDDENYEMFKKERKRVKERDEDLKILHNSMFS